MDVGVIGSAGVVGGAIARAFAENGRVWEYDKKSNSSDTWQDFVEKTDMVFVAVPTPTIEGEQDLAALHDVLTNLVAHAYNGVVCIKCTMVPGTTVKLRERFDLRLVHNPEFLTAARPYEDFINQKAVILGGDIIDCAIVEMHYRRLLPSVNVYSYQNPTVTEMAKYYHNCFLATKVTLANEFYDLSQRLQVSYDEVRSATLTQGGLGDGHTRVPGPDGKTGYGLGCFPKDMLALIGFCASFDVPCEVLSAAHQGNSRRRKFDKACREVS